MVQLTGGFAEEAQGVLDTLHIGIDVGKRIVIASHDFTTKLSAVDMVFMHTQMEYQDYDELHEFFVDVSDVLVELRDELDALRKGEIYFIVKLEAAEKRKNWTLTHFKKIKKELHQVEDVDRKIFFVIHAALEKVRQLFQQAEHLFELDIKKATVDVKVELEEGEEEVKHILERLIQFILAYEQIFKKELKKLKRL